MKQHQTEVRTSRFISYVLRHQPSAAGIELDAHGWADVKQLLAGCNRAGVRINIDMLQRIVREDDKQRYSFSEDGERIRANQGHSVKVDVELRQAVPPNLLYHGTAERFLDRIFAEGIKPVTRLHVHLSDNEQTALQVGKRHGSPVVLRVDAAAMYRDGYPFYVSENGVWLCERVARKYISRNPL